MTAVDTEIEGLDVSDVDLESIQLCGEPECLAVELYADGLCWTHFKFYEHERDNRYSMDRNPWLDVLHAEPGLRKPAHLRKVQTFGCAVDGCPALTIKARGWCAPHYNRWVRHGDPGPAELYHQGPPPPRALNLTIDADPLCGLHTAHLFDPARDEETKAQRRARHWQAAQLCQRCPALAQCTQNLPDLREDAPVTKGGAGVWANHQVLATSLTEIEDPGFRRCTQCEEKLPLGRFPLAVQDGRSEKYQCSACISAANKTPEARAYKAEKARERRKRNPEAQKAADRRWRERLTDADRAAINERQRANAKARRERDPEKHAADLARRRQSWTANAEQINEARRTTRAVASA